MDESEMTLVSIDAPILMPSPVKWSRSALLRNDDQFLVCSTVVSLKSMTYRLPEKSIILMELSKLVLSSIEQPSVELKINTRYSHHQQDPGHTHTMIPFLNQLATSWQTQGDFPLVSGLCARLCQLGVVLLDTFDSSVLQAEAFIASSVGVEKDCSVNEEASCGFPIQNTGSRQGCTRIASIAHRLLQLCDQFELEFEGRGLPTDAAEGDRMEDLHTSMLFVSEYLREWCEVYM